MSQLDTLFHTALSHLAVQLEDLLLRMAEVHDHLPEIKILWLRKLAAHHLRRETFAEAAQVCERVK